MFSEFLMKAKKVKSVKSKPKKTRKKSTKKSRDNDDDGGVILIDDDLEIDSEKVLEERKAYLEESRSQDTTD
tara:strand:- start:261 stop:476 length:216 start_codon:yes stop_codon:yes gene_type:complete